MGPLPLEISRVGVYADDQFIHAAEVRRRLAGAEIVRAASAPLDSAAPDAFASALKQALRAAGITARKVSMALKGSDAFLRYFEMPILPRREWANGVRFESQKYAPFAVAEAVSGFQIAAESDMKALKVAFTGAKKTTVAAAASVLKRSGLEPVSIEPLAFSILRAYSARGKAPEGSCEALVHSNPSGPTSLIIVKDGLPYFVRHSSAAAAGYEDVLAEIRMAVDYFAKYFRSEKVGRLVLCGLSDASWAGRLAQEFGVPAEPAAGIANAAGEAGARPGAVCAAGAALGGLTWQRHGVNFIAAQAEPEIQAARLSPAEERRALGRAAGIGASALAAVVVLAYAALALSHHALGAASARLDAEERRLEPSGAAAPMEELEQRVASLGEKNAFVKSLTDDRVFWTDKMSAIARLLPQSARLTLAHYADDETAGSRELSLEGLIEPSAAADAVDIVNRFVADLGADAAFMKGLDEAKVAFIRAGGTVSGTGPATFSVTCRSERKKTGEAAS